MEELTEILTWLKLRLHSKPVGILNCGGYYDHFLQWVSLIYTCYYFFAVFRGYTVASKM